MGPVQGLNAEAGIKGEWRDGALNGSLVLYRTEQRNAPVIDGSIVANTPEDLECCYLARSNNSSGVDVELHGEVARGWQIGAGYTYNVNEAIVEGPLSSFTPRHLLKAWTNVRLPGDFRRWELGGSLHAQSRTTTRRTFCVSRAGAPCNDTVLEGEQPSYFVLDLRAGFDVSEDWHLALALNNALDKIYYESIEHGTFYSWYGEPRNWTLRIDGRF